MQSRCCKSLPSKLQIGQKVQYMSSRTFMERMAIERDSRVCEGYVPFVNFLSTTGHEKSCGKPPGPPGKAKYILRPIVNKFREGKVKSTPGRGVK